LPRFFIEEPPAGEALIRGEDARHIGRSLRMKPGEELTLCCGGTDHFCRIISITADEVRCEVLSSERSSAEPRLKLTLFQALPKSDKMELIVQKAVELGAGRIVPVLTSRCVSRPDTASAAKKCERWQKIALAAAKQSGRGIIPEVGGVISFEECLAAAGEYDRAFFCYEGGGESLAGADLSDTGTAALIVGPEGGFEPSEAEAARFAGLRLTSLGKRILRCETAPIAAIAAIMLLSGDL